ncbi:hypothetical protein DFH27DRAFT_612658 [Peziza echinospora]|nr:hypothetical protein DFH27DRAFT_612658 [Peziza echinospora]
MSSLDSLTLSASRSSAARIYHTSTPLFNLEQLPDNLADQYGAPPLLLDGNHWTKPSTRKTRAASEATQLLPPTAPVKKKQKRPSNWELAGLGDTSRNLTPLLNLNSSLREDSLVDNQDNSFFQPPGGTEEEDNLYEDDLAGGEPEEEVVYNLRSSEKYTKSPEGRSPNFEESDREENNQWREPSQIGSDDEEEEADKTIRPSSGNSSPSGGSQADKSTVWSPRPATETSFLDIFVPRLPPSVPSIPDLIAGTRKMAGRGSTGPAPPDPAPGRRSQGRTDADWERMKRMQEKYTELERKLNGLLARQTAEEKAKEIERTTEEARRKAYEEANIPYPGPPSTQMPRQSSPYIEFSDFKISHRSIGYLKPPPGGQTRTKWEGIENDVYVRPMTWLARVKTKIDSRDDMAYKAKVLQVASECLQGRAASWWTAIGENMRTILLADFSLRQWKSSMECLCPSKDQMRKDAHERKWNQFAESVMDYVWDKAAMLSELDVPPADSTAISLILDGLPPNLASMSRTEFEVAPTIEMLSKELQILVPRWEKSHQQDQRRIRLTSQAQRDPIPTRAGRSYTSYQAGQSQDVRQSVGNQSVRMTQRTATVDASLASSLDKSKLAMRIHPDTGKETRSYMKPNGRILYLARNCRTCGKEHFDFEHDSNPIALTVSAYENSNLDYEIDDDPGYEEFEPDSSEESETSTQKFKVK